MKQFIRLMAAGVVCAMPHLAAAQTAPAISPAISTPDKAESRLGTLEFKDGAPNTATVTKVYDHVDFTHAYNAFVNTMQGVSIAAIRKGMLSIGVKDNQVLVFSELMDAKSLFLTANADTVYFFGGLDLSKGPMVLEMPPKALGAIDDQWFRWVIDIGLPGLDGFGVARQVRAQLGPEVLLIALSGYGQEEDRRNSFAAGFDVHYLKPVDTERLLRLLSISHSELMRRKLEGSLARA